MTRVLYGVENDFRDVTEQALRLCESGNGILMIPSEDEQRAELFGDFHYGKQKTIVALFGNNGNNTTNTNQGIVYNAGQPAFIPLDNILQEKIKTIFPIGNPETYLQKIHSKLTFTGDIKDEYPEQLMAVSFIKPTDKVLELGANIGRNTCVIASILEDSANLTTLETDSIEALSKNRNANNFSFKIINAALSKRKLFQRNWITVSADTAPGPDWFAVQTVSYQDILSTSNNPTIPFDVLVADCEGALYYIVYDFPEMFSFDKNSGLKTIIVENDYGSMEQKIFVDHIFRLNGFNLVYNKPGGVPYSWLPCKGICFYQVWQR
uniref:Methyltransferase FkbM domain-containing protein n=1 Tax=viral metagenome TaxID=1070528 RepID=A0A6C0JRX7_9ZZZZ